jgi:hypothetical protein
VECGRRRNGRSRSQVGILNPLPSDDHGELISGFYTPVKAQ